MYSFPVRVDRSTLFEKSSSESFYAMDELAADLRAFLLNHPFLQLTDSKKVRQLNPPDYAKPPLSRVVMLAALLAFPPRAATVALSAKLYFVVFR